MRVRPAQDKRMSRSVAFILDADRHCPTTVVALPPFLIVVLVHRHEDLRRCNSGDARVKHVHDSF